MRAWSKRRARRLNGFESLEPRQMLAVVINEIHFDPNIATEQVEFIELHNTGAAPVDLSGWRIDEAVDFTFPGGSSIAPGGYLVVTQDVADFQAKFGFAPFGQWETGDRLANEGEVIELRDAFSALIDAVDYNQGFPWPTSGDFGSSIELINPNLDNDLGGNWRSSGIASTPGAGTVLVPSGATWRYRKGLTANPPTVAGNPAQNWQLTGFVETNDSVAWQGGTASIGYGDGDDATVLSDMRFNYSTIYLRKQFVIAGDVPDRLKLRIYLDDGAIVTINGHELPRFHVTAGDKDFDDTSGESHEAIWEEFLLPNADEYLVLGTNTIAVHVLNEASNSSDLSFNLELSIPTDTVGTPTPGEQNSVFAANSAPQMRQLTQSVQQPTSGQDVVVSIKATDPDGVASMNLEYQVVQPGAYVRITDAAYNTGWTTLAMHDDGVNGDAVAGDSLYSVIIPASVQVNRRLIRYRITATDTLGASIRGPYVDDPQPNFAYFVYDGVPDYTASLNPGALPNVVYRGDALDDVATYHLIANATDVQNSQYNGAFNEVEFRGTLVYDGVVYDHVYFRNRGVASTYAVGKNKWKIEFNTGHEFQARDNYGVPYVETWDEINVLPGTNPWWRNDVSTDGTVLFEPAAFKLYELAGAPAPKTHYFQFRVIDAASETGANQYGGDFWGLYIGIEQPDGSFLDERGLPDGNMYNMHSSVFGATNQRHQGSQSVTNRSDLAAFMAGIDGGFETLAWWEANLNWDVYFAWNIINHVVNNSDIRPNENVNYYRNEETGQWYVIPWDLDLTFEDAPHFGNPVTNRENIRSLMRDHPLAKLAYENRLREITDLLLASGDAGRVVTELFNVLTLGGGDLSVVNANQAMWDYHPQKVKKGIWYENFNPALLPSETFAGVAAYMQSYMAPGGYGYDLLQGQGNDTDIPVTPTIAYSGAPGFAADGIAFQASAFNDPQGAGTFSKMEWRVAEVYNSSTSNYVAGTPYRYEIEGTWESGELATFANTIAVPAGAVEPGKTYRARVRMQDADGHWSHWSTAVEFVAGPNVATPTLAITEFHYNPAAVPSVPAVVDAQDLEFVEVLNTGASTVDLTGVQLTSFATTPYTFGAGLSLAPGQRIVVPKNPTSFQLVYGTDVYISPGGYGSANLSNSGETIQLVAASGAVIHSVTYSDGGAWSESADGDGPSLEIINPSGDPNAPANWQASLMTGGSPGWDGQPGLAGDYNRDDVVDGTDFLVWQRTLGSRTPALLSADGNGNLQVDGADLGVWTEEFSAAVAVAAPAPPIEEAVNLSAVEPTSASHWFVTSQLLDQSSRPDRRPQPTRHKLAFASAAPSHAVRTEISSDRLSMRRHSRTPTGEGEPDRPLPDPGRLALDEAFAVSEGFRRWS